MERGAQSVDRWPRDSAYTYVCFLIFLTHNLMQREKKSLMILVLDKVSLHELRITNHNHE